MAPVRSRNRCEQIEPGLRIRFFLMRRRCMGGVLLIVSRIYPLQRPADAARTCASVISRLSPPRARCEFGEAGSLCRDALREVADRGGDFRSGGPSSGTVVEFAGMNVAHGIPLLPGHAASVPDRGIG